MFSRFLNSELLKRPVTVIGRCLLNTLNEGPKGFKGTLPILEYKSSWIYRENNKVNSSLPPSLPQNNLFVPSALTWVYPQVYPSVFPFEYPLDEAPKLTNEIKDPSLGINCPKEAVRLIVIRRKKMRKHKLRKLRKRMKFEWAKLRQRREFKREKLFQAGLVQQCKEGEAFSAENYIEEKLNKLHEVIIPRFLKGKRYPEFLMRQKLGLPPK